MLRILFRRSIQNKIKKHICNNNNKRLPSKNVYLFKKFYTNENEPVKANQIENELNTTFQYNVILKEYLDKGIVTFVFKLYQEMINKGIKPDQISYNLLLTALQQSGQTSRCLMYLREMEEKGLASTTSYSIVIKAFYATQDADKALELYNEMIQKGKTPNAVILNELLYTQSSTNDWKSALKLMDEFTKFNVIPTVDTYTNLLLCLSYSNDPSIVLEWWKKADEDLKSRGTKIEIPLMVIEKLFGYMLSYNYVEGIDFYMSKCPIIKRSEYLKALIVLARVDKPDIEKAEHYFNEYDKQYGVNNSAVLCLIIVYIRTNNFKKAIKLMNESNFEIHMTVIKMLSDYLIKNPEDIDEAYYYLEELKQNNQKIKIEPFHSIIRACCLVNDLDKAYGTYLELENFGLTCNEKTFEMLLSSPSVANKKYIQTMEEEIEKHNINLNSIIVSNLLRLKIPLLPNCKSILKAIKDSMRDTIVIDFHVFYIACNRCVEEDEYEVGEEIIKLASKYHNTYILSKKFGL